MAEPGSENIAIKNPEAVPENEEVGTEVTEMPPPDIRDLCRETFEKTALYLHGELSSTTEDYKLLEQMNMSTIQKYTEMKQIATNINRAVKDLNARYESLQPFLEQLDQVDESVSALEQAAYKLDAYSKRLESKFKQLEKR